jgi:hypothetical protein
MKQAIFCTLCCAYSITGFSQNNVGIGTPVPTEARLVVTGGAGGSQGLFGKGVNGVSIESGPASINFNNYYLNNDGRKLIAAGYSGQFTYDNTTGILNYKTSTASGVANGPTGIMNPLMSVTRQGNLGIGTSTEMGLITTRGTIGAVAALFGDNTTGIAIENSYPGIGINTYYNGGRKFIAAGYGGLLGMDPVLGNFYLYTSAAAGTLNGAATMNLRMMIAKTGSVGIEGNSNPLAPLSFASTVGNKIALWGDADAAHYGVGIQGALLQVYTSGANADIAMGYGTSAAFTEKYRFGNNGYLNIKNGRIRFTGQYDAGNPQGIEFTNLAGNALKGYIGQFDNNQMGFFGYSGAGWALLFNQTTGQLNLGATRNAFDANYKLNVGGKILAEEVRVLLQNAWPDYVFAKDYKLMPLQQLHEYIQANNHLPDMPAATELQASGVDMGEMQRKMMEKIEELTLYVIDLKKEIEILKRKTP